MSVAQGGKFGNGFASAGASTLVSPMMPAEGNARVIVAAIVGGTISEVTGGKFGNGAWTAAFSAAVKNVGQEISANVSADVKLDAQAASCAYTQKAECGPMTRIGNGFNFRSGLKVAIYRNADGSGPFRVGFAGTDGLDGPDIIADVAQGIGLQTTQYDEAIYLAHALQTQYGNDIVFVGHSLGGGLASAAARITGLNAVTFNAAGLSARYGGNLNTGSIRAYYTRSDLLSLSQDVIPGVPSAAGQRIVLPGHGVHQMAGVCHAMGINC